MPAAGADLCLSLKESRPPAGDLVSVLLEAPQPSGGLLRGQEDGPLPCLSRSRAREGREGRAACKAEDQNRRRAAYGGRLG